MRYDSMFVVVVDDDDQYSMPFTIKHTFIPNCNYFNEVIHSSIQANAIDYFRTTPLYKQKRIQNPRQFKIIEI